MGNVKFPMMSQGFLLFLVKKETVIISILKWPRSYVFKKLSWCYVTNSTKKEFVAVVEIRKWQNQSVCKHRVSVVLTLTW